jgi:hypothetical protein
LDNLRAEMSPTARSQLAPLDMAPTQSPAAILASPTEVIWGRDGCLAAGSERFGCGTNRNTIVAAKTFLSLSPAKRQQPSRTNRRDSPTPEPPGRRLVGIDRSDLVRWRTTSGKAISQPAAVRSTGVIVNCPSARLFLISSSVFQPGSRVQYDATTSCCAGFQSARAIFIPG